MCTPSGRMAAVCLALCLAVGAVSAAGPNRGQPIDPAAIGAWDISVQPDGTGLPPGAGTPAQGARLYAEKCAQCHGSEGQGGVAGVTSAPLVGGGAITERLSENLFTPSPRNQAASWR